MKKFLCTMLAILLVFALSAAGGYGYAWYRCNHVFVDGEAYPLDLAELDVREKEISLEEYVTLKASLPNCDIRWNVPFQGSSFDSKSEILTIGSLTEEEVYQMASLFANLKTLDASQCQDYEMIRLFQTVRPDCVVVSTVSLGPKTVDAETTELLLVNGDYEFDALMNNLQHLTSLQSITFKTPDLTLEQLKALEEAYTNVTFKCTAEVLGVEYDTETTEIDLSMMESQDVAEVAQKLAMLPKLQRVELMDANGQAKLAVQDVKTLQAAAPGVGFNYTFDFFGTTVSTADKEVIIANASQITDANESELRAALELMSGCERFVLDGCKISDEKMAKLRDEYRENAVLVWRIQFGDGGSALTDHEVIMCSGTLGDTNCQELKYCEGVRFMDLGHNDYLTDISFIAGMPNLEAVILSGSSIKDLTPLSGCKKLQFLEVAFCGYVADLSPLASCESLKMLNIGYTAVSDLAALDNLPMTHLSAKRPSPKISAAERERFDGQHPDCWTEYIGSQPYGVGWRYDTNNTTYLPYYAMLRVIFKYPAPDSGIKVGPNKRGWYLDSCEDLSQWMDIVDDKFVVKA